MNICEDEPRTSARTRESLPDIDVTDHEFKLLCTQWFGFPTPDQLEPAKDQFDPILPVIWPENDLKGLYDPKNGEPDMDAQISTDDFALMHTPDVLPPEVFGDEIPYLKIWDVTYWKRRKVEEGNVFCPVSYQVFNLKKTKQPAFSQRCGMCVNPKKLLDIMEHVYPQVASEVALTLKAIMDPKFYMPVKCGKESKRKMTEADLQKEAKETLVKKVISSAYYRILFNRHDLEEYPADELTIMRALCPLREEDEANTHSL